MEHARLTKDWGPIPEDTFRRATGVWQRPGFSWDSVPAEVRPLLKPMVDEVVADPQTALRRLRAVGSGRAVMDPLAAELLRGAAAAAVCLSPAAAGVLLRGGLFQAMVALDVRLNALIEPRPCSTSWTRVPEYAMIAPAMSDIPELLKDRSVAVAYVALIDELYHDRQYLQHEAVHETTAHFQRWQLLGALGQVFRLAAEIKWPHSNVAYTTGCFAPLVLSYFVASTRAVLVATGGGVFGSSSDTSGRAVRDWQLACNAMFDSVPTWCVTRPQAHADTCSHATFW